MSVELNRFSIDVDSDVFAIRQRGREVAAVVGFDRQDQVRIATALSEVGREILDPGGGGTAIFALDLSGDATLIVTISSALPLLQVSLERSPTGLAAAARLMDGVDVAPAGTGTVVSLRKRIPSAARPRRIEIPKIRVALAAAVASSPLDELRTQNRELVATLDQLTEKQADLMSINAELEETNRGVLAMYTELSGELEETNRGVVALYGELDDKTVQLQQASEAKSRFLASISHELRTPVNSVLALSKLLVEVDSDPLSPDQRRQIELINHSASDLLQLVNDLLDLAKAESGRLEPDIADVQIGPLFAELRGTLRPLVPESIKLEFVESAPLSTIETDRVLLTHILRNLVSNSLKFTEEGSVIVSATMRESAQHVEISVADTGIGISADDQTRIFEEFYQVRGPLQALHRGTGLGLPYVRRVVDALGGTIHLESVVGEGTTMTLRLPVRWSASLGSQQLPVDEPPTGTIDVGTALVVDDDPIFREALRAMLQGIAERVLEASDGESALKLAAASQPDVIFLDVRMPDIDGVEVLRRMDADPALWHIPVVIVTSLEIDSTMQARLRHGSASLAKSSLSRDRIRALLRQIGIGGRTS